MARTVDHEAHATRRKQILDVARELVVTRGYEQMSIQDVLTELGISKGALYHYFGSKQELLTGIVDRMADEVHAQLSPVAEDSRSGAADKLTQIFRALAGWKTRNRKQLVVLLRAWNSDSNTLMRHKTRVS